MLLKKKFISEWIPNLTYGLCVLLQNLPTVSECVQAIISVAPSYSTKKRRKFTSCLCELWVKSYTDKHVITLK